MQATPGSLYVPRPDGAGRSISPYESPPVARLTLFGGGPGTGKTTELDQLGHFAADRVPRPVSRVDPVPGEVLESAVARAAGRMDSLGGFAYDLGMYADRRGGAAVIAIDDLQNLDRGSLSRLVALATDDRLTDVLERAGRPPVQFVASTADPRMEQWLRSELGSQVDVRLLRPFTAEELAPLLERELGGLSVQPGADHALLQAANGSAGHLKVLTAGVLQHPRTRQTGWVTVEAAGEAIRPEPTEFQKILDASPRPGTGKKPDPGAETTVPIRRPGQSPPSRGQTRG